MSSDSWTPRYPQLRAQLADSGPSPSGDRLLTVPLPSHPSPRSYRSSSLTAPVGGFFRPHETLRNRPKSSHSRIPSPLSTIIDVEIEKLNSEPFKQLQDISDEQSSSSSLRPGKGKEKANDTDTESYRSFPSSLNRTRPSSIRSAASERSLSHSHQRRLSITSTSRDPNLNWMTAPPSPTPVFTRGQISSHHVVMPLSASELVRKKTKISFKDTVARPRTAVVNPVARNDENELPSLVRRRANTLATPAAPPNMPLPKPLKNKSGWASKILIRPRTAPGSIFQSVNHISQSLDSLVPPSSPSPLASPTPSSTSFSSLLSSKSATSTVTSISSSDTDIVVTPPTPMRKEEPALDGVETENELTVTVDIVDVVIDPDYARALGDDAGYSIGASATGPVPRRIIDTLARAGPAEAWSRPVLGRHASRSSLSKVPASARTHATRSGSGESGSISKKFKGRWKRLFFR